MKVVVDTTKVRFFKQITTTLAHILQHNMLLLTPQRYDFSSKSQLICYLSFISCVVVDTTKVRFFKQITTFKLSYLTFKVLLLTPQRYDFSSKSQQLAIRY